MEALNKKVSIRSEMFDVVLHKEERVKFIENLIRSVNEQVK